MKAGSMELPGWTVSKTGQQVLAVFLFALRLRQRCGQAYTTAQVRIASQSKWVWGPGAGRLGQRLPQILDEVFWVF